MTNQEIMDLADEYLYDTGGKNHGIIEFTRAVESRTRAAVIGEWFQQGAWVEREACAKLCENITDIDEDVDDYYSHIYATAIRARGK